MKKIFLLLVSFLLGSTFVYGQMNYEKTTPLNEGWRFLRQDVGSIWEVVRPVAKGNPESVPVWTQVTLPHCFNAEDAVDPDTNYYQGPGWYRTELKLENPYSGGRTLLHFEGAGQKTEVYVFQEKVGVHIGGYDEWIVDITEAAERFLASKEAARFKGRVPIGIRCDNTRDTEMMPSDLSDFNVYGGLYRYVNLVYTPAITFSSIHADASVDENGARGQLRINASFIAPEGSDPSTLSIKLYDPDGDFVYETEITIKSYADHDVLQWQVDKPALWCVDKPQLYTCELTLQSPAGKTTCREKFGFRHFEFVEKGPFKLNGRRLLLRGTHRHEDHAGVGQAMTRDMIVREMEMMKKMGVNFIRLGHYQQSRIVLDECDRLGILVWEEIPWCRGGLGGEQYQEQGKRMLANMITQHRNHPSIILWGMGNENDWSGDFPQFDKEAIRKYMKELHDLSHQLDPTRLTCIRRCDFCKDIIDVYSPSIWAGWYRGLYTDYKKVSEAEMKRVNRFLHVEWGGDSHAGRHAENSYDMLKSVSGGGDKADERDGDASLYGGMARASKDGDWSETYICDLIDWHLKEQETMPWLTGTAYWPFKDFSTPVRPENPVPYMNQKGVVERDMTPKESYYVFQSYWADEPMVHIYGHSWPTRWGKEGETKLVKVYSNCMEVELILNGKSLGMKKRNSQDFPAAGLRWECVFRPGQNILKAISKSNGESVTDEITFDYETRPLGKEAKLVVTKQDAGSGEVWIKAEIQSKEGVVCLQSRKGIEFDSIGDGELIVNQGTARGSRKVQASNGRAMVKLKKGKGADKVSVKSSGLETVFIDID